MKWSSYNYYNHFLDLKKVGGSLKVYTWYLAELGYKLRQTYPGTQGLYCWIISPKISPKLRNFTWSTLKKISHIFKVCHIIAIFPTSSHCLIQTKFFIHFDGQLFKGIFLSILISTFCLFVLLTQEWNFWVICENIKRQLIPNQLIPNNSTL